MSALALFDWMAQHQETLTWLGGGVATGAGGLCVAVRYLLDRKDKSDPSDGKSKQSSKPAYNASTGVGSAAGRDLRIGGDLTIQQSRIPKSAIGLAALGLLLLGYAAFNSGSRVEVSAPSGVAAQSITGSPININPQSPLKGTPQ
jgi:ammonia channel protein AmtB